jgi:hypothetical protein
LSTHLFPNYFPGLFPQPKQMGSGGEKTGVTPLVTRPHFVVRSAAGTKSSEPTLPRSERRYTNANTYARASCTRLPPRYRGE